MTDAAEKVARAIYDLRPDVTLMGQMRTDGTNGRDPLIHPWEEASEETQEMREQDARAALSTLTPGTRFTAADGREMVVVPVEASETMRDDIADGDEGEAFRCLAAMIAAASEPDAPSQASDVKEGG